MYGDGRVNSIIPNMALIMAGRYCEPSHQIKFIIWGLFLRLLRPDGVPYPNTYIRIIDQSLYEIQHPGDLKVEEDEGFFLETNSLC